MTSYFVSVCPSVHLVDHFYWSYVCLLYFSLLSEEVRSRKFSVVVAADGTHDFLLRNAIISLNEFEVSYSNF